jgi:hypothetical protein
MDPPPPDASYFVVKGRCALHQSIASEYARQHFVIEIIAARRDVKAAIVSSDFALGHEHPFDSSETEHVIEFQQITRNLSRVPIAAKGDLFFLS